MSAKVIDSSGNEKITASPAHTVTVAEGGTGLTTLTAHGVLIGEGTSNIAVTSAGTTGQFLSSNGASADPTWASVSTALSGIFKATPLGGKRVNYVAPTDTSSLAFAYGWIVAAAGTASIVNDNTSFWYSLSSASTCRIDFGSGFKQTRLEQQPTFQLHFRTGSDITNVRYLISIVDAIPANSDTTNNARKGVGVVYSTVRADSGWMTWKADGTTQTVGSQITTIAASTVYTLTIAVGASSTVLTINGSSQTITNPSVTSQDISPCMQLFPTSGTKVVDFSRAYLETN